MSKSMEEIILAFSEKYKGDYQKIYHALATKERLTDEEVRGYVNQIECNYTDILSEDYPEVFKERVCPPIVLYYEGNLDLVDDEIKVLESPMDKTRRFFFNLDINDEGIDYFIGCENRKSLEQLLEYFIDNHPELPFINYREKEGESKCL